jgi:hypothetical protein
MHRDHSLAPRRRIHPVHSPSFRQVLRTEVAPSHALKTTTGFIAIPEFETGSKRAVAPWSVSEAESLDSFPSEKKEQSRAECVLFDGSVPCATLNDFPSEVPARCKSDTPADQQQIGQLRRSGIAHGGLRGSVMSPISIRVAFADVLRSHDTRRHLRVVTQQLRRFREMANGQCVGALKTGRGWIAAITGGSRWWRRACG